MRRTYWKQQRSWSQLMAIGCLAFWSLAIGTDSISAMGLQEVFNNGISRINANNCRQSDLFGGQGIAADDVTFTNTTVVTEVQWSGAYGSPTFPLAPATDDFTIAIYASVGGAPNGAPLATFDVGNDVNRTGPFTNAFFINLYEYSAAINFTFDAQTTYWVSIYNKAIGNGAPSFCGLTRIPGGNEQSSTDGGLSWSNGNGHQLHITMFGFEPEKRDWVHADSGSFAQDACWLPTGTPNSNQSAVFDLDSGFFVNWLPTTGNQTVSNMVLSKGQAQFNNTDSQQHEFAPTNGLAVFGTGSQLVVNGLDLQTGGIVVVDAGADLSIGSTGSIVTAITSNTTTIGAQGVGNLTISDQATVNDAFAVIGSSTGSNGTATVTGVGSIWNTTDRMIVAPNGTATLNIESGGLVDTVGTAIVAARPGSFGTVSVDGAGSEWSIMGGMQVGGGIAGFSLVNGGEINVNGVIQNSGTILISSTGGKLNASTIINDQVLNAFSGDVEIDSSITNNNLFSQTAFLTTIDGSVTNAAENLSSGLLTRGLTRIEGTYNGGATNYTNSLISEDARVELAGAFRPANVSSGGQTTFTGLVQFDGVSLELTKTRTNFIE